MRGGDPGRRVPVAVVGPTATGKSDLGLELADQLGGEIVNADAMQRYRGMDIGTAKLPVAQRRGIVHHQLDVLEVTATASVARYQESGAADIEAILARGKTPIIVGGSMMYIQALLDDWQIPATDPQVRARLESELEADGVEAMFARLRSTDPVAAQTILATDSRRIVRALEVVEITGQPFAASAPRKGVPRWGTRIVALDRDTDELDKRIATRTAAMFAEGFVDEVRELIGKGLREGKTAVRAIGYAQVLAAIDGEYDMATAAELTTAGTRRYVRRQRSWFRRDPRIRWLAAVDDDLCTKALAIATAAQPLT